ncbi:MAG: DUF1902 domain-containing protein [Alphaproteobacteria bacterium]|nr:DUF1902 domain-containing protein [Alphaproteobacteria bacterium]
MKRAFYVKALWDDKAKIWYSESDIFGLHIEAKTIPEFEAVMNEFAAELIVANHLTSEELAGTSIRDLLPTIVWQPPSPVSAAA